MREGRCISLIERLKEGSELKSTLSCTDPYITQIKGETNYSSGILSVRSIQWRSVYHKIIIPYHRP